MENTEYVTIRVAVKQITANDGNFTIDVSSIGPVCAAYWLNYGARQSVKDKVAGQEKALTALHHVVTLSGDATPTQTKQFRNACDDAGLEIGEGKRMTTEDFVSAVIDARMLARWNDAVDEKLWPEVEAKRLRGDAKMARDIATFWVRGAFEQAGKKITGPDFDAAIDAALVNVADKIAAEVARRKAAPPAFDLDELLNKAA